MIASSTLMIDTSVELHIQHGHEEAHQLKYSRTRQRVANRTVGEGLEMVDVG